LSTTSTTAAPQPPARIDMSDVDALGAVVDALAATVLPDNLRPGLRTATADRPVLYDNGCHRWMKTSALEQCIFGDPAGSITIAIWGDSHMVQWFNALDQIAITHHWRIIPITQGGCPFLEIPTYNGGAGGRPAQLREVASLPPSMRDQHVDVCCSRRVLRPAR
jgi:hypothetical protein